MKLDDFDRVSLLRKKLQEQKNLRDALVNGQSQKVAVAFGYADDNPAAALRPALSGIVSTSGYAIILDTAQSIGGVLAVLVTLVDQRIQAIVNEMSDIGVEIADKDLADLGSVSVIPIGARPIA